MHRVCEEQNYSLNFIVSYKCCSNFVESFCFQDEGILVEHKTTVQNVMHTFHKTIVQNVMHTYQLGFPFEDCHVSMTVLKCNNNIWNSEYLNCFFLFPIYGRGWPIFSSLLYIFLMWDALCIIRLGIFKFIFNVMFLSCHPLSQFMPN